MKICPCKLCGAKVEWDGQEVFCLCEPCEEKLVLENFPQLRVDPTLGRFLGISLKKESER
jgi:hypothetical protein